MQRCTIHKTCSNSYVQGPEDVDTLIQCMVQRGLLVRYERFDGRVYWRRGTTR